MVFDYRKAPEHPFPAADDALAAYRVLLDEGVPASSIVVAGDSAEGGLTIALLVSARDTGLPQPSGAVNAAHAGVEVRLHVFPEMQHVFQTGLGQLPESDDAIARIGAFVCERLG